MKIDDYFIAAVTRQILGNVTDEWFAEDWNCRLGAVFG